MASQSVGYVHEIAALVLGAERSGEDATKYYAVAFNNGVAEDQIHSAKRTLLRLDDSSGKGIDRYIHRLYVQDGLKRGYVKFGEQNAHTTWVLGQLARDHYGE